MIFSNVCLKPHEKMIVLTGCPVSGSASSGALARLSAPRRCGEVAGADVARKGLGGDGQRTLWECWRRETGGIGTSGGAATSRTERNGCASHSGMGTWRSASIDGRSSSSSTSGLSRSHGGDVEGGGVGLAMKLIMC
jgi:hypothetical protein